MCSDCASVARFLLELSAPTSMSMLSSKSIFESSFSEQVIRDVSEIHTSTSAARGVDGAGFEVFVRDIDQHVALIESKSQSGSYRFSPYREKLISKERG